MDLSEYVGRPIILCGLANNARAGAILVCGPNSHVYIEGVAIWPDEHVNRAFEVRGVLAEAGSSADLRSPDGRRHRQGVGRYYIVREPTVELIPRP